MIMADDSLGNFTKSVLIFMGGVAVGYSIKKFVESDSFDEIKSEAIGFINAFTEGNYEDNTDYVDINIDSDDVEDVVEDVSVENKEYVKVDVTGSDSKKSSGENDAEDIDITIT